MFTLCLTSNEDDDTGKQYTFKVSLQDAIKIAISYADLLPKYLIEVLDEQRKVVFFCQQNIQ